MPPPAPASDHGRGTAPTPPCASGEMTAMLDERLLDDRGRCPGCASALRGPRTERCPNCSIRLVGPAADELWLLSLSTARMLRQRQSLLAGMRLEAKHAGRGAGSPATSASP